MLANGVRPLRRVLVIGEGPDQAKAFAFRLGLRGIEAAPSAAELTLAVRSVLSFKPHLVLLDGSSGEKSRELFTFLADVSDTPIVVLGDARRESDLVWYLEHGAADYVSRSVSEAVLVARITAILRRIEDAEGNGTLSIGSLEVDTERHQVRKNGKIVQLTPTEFRILRVLAENAGKPCGHRMILERVWGEEFSDCSHYLRLYVGYLRQKLEENPKRPRLLLTEWGVGYRLVPDRAAASASVARTAAAVSA